MELVGKTGSALRFLEIANCGRCSGR